MPLDLVNARLQVVFCDVGDDSAVGVGDRNTDIACGLEVDRDGGVVETLDSGGGQLICAGIRGGIVHAAVLAYRDAECVGDSSPVRDEHCRVFGAVYDGSRSGFGGIPVIVPTVFVVLVFVVNVNSRNFGLERLTLAIGDNIGSIVGFGENAVAFERVRFRGSEGRGHKAVKQVGVSIHDVWRNIAFIVVLVVLVFRVVMALEFVRS